MKYTVVIEFDFEANSVDEAFDKISILMKENCPTNAEADIYTTDNNFLDLVGSLENTQ